jgi:hypothetical protein
MHRTARRARRQSARRVLVTLSQERVAGVARPARIADDTGMNQESLERANAFLAAVAARASVGELIDLSPAELGREIGVQEPLAAARAVRALLARRRLEAVDGRYRLVDPRPIEAGEREQVPRPRRPRGSRAGRAARSEPAPQGGRTAYADVGREAIDKLIELGREVGVLRGALRTAREEVRDAQAGRDDAERRASTLAARVKELEAKGAGRDAPVGDSEMEAILGVLKGGHEGGDEATHPAPRDGGAGAAARGEGSLTVGPGTTG